MQAAGVGGKNDTPRTSKGFLPELLADPHAQKNMP